jgi:hypothetical protein
MFFMKMSPNAHLHTAPLGSRKCELKAFHIYIYIYINSFFGNKNGSEVSYYAAGEGTIWVWRLPQLESLKIQ